MRTVLTIVAMIIFLWVIAFSFAVRNVMAWERIEIMHDESFLSAKPVECTFDKEMIEAHIKRMGEVPLGTAKTVMSNGTDVFDVEVRFYANFDAKTISIFEVFPDGSVCLTLQAENLIILPYGIPS